MTRNTATTGRSWEALGEFSENDTHESVGRYEHDAFDRLQAELLEAFAAEDSTYKPLTAAEVIARNIARPPS